MSTPSINKDDQRKQKRLFAISHGMAAGPEIPDFNPFSEKAVSDWRCVHDPVPNKLFPF
jgi:hypothetical protein